MCLCLCTVFSYLFFCSHTLHHDDPEHACSGFCCCPHFSRCLQHVAVMYLQATVPAALRARVHLAVLARKLAVPVVLATRRQSD